MASGVQWNETYTDPESDQRDLLRAQIAQEPGAAMAVNQDGVVSGSVSGGCVESAVVAEALEILASDSPGRLVKFGYSDDEAFAVGLTCGGVVHLFIQPLNW